MTDPHAPDPEPVTLWLAAVAAGDVEAEARVAQWVYDRLEVLADRRLRREFPEGGITLEPAALVNETFLKVLQNPIVFQNRRHYFAFVAKVMLRVLIDYRRARLADKRGGGVVFWTLEGVASGSAAPVDVLALQEAIERLEVLDARKAEVTRLRVLWGLELAEIAEIVGVAEPTVRRDWRFARSWLAVELQEGR